MKESALQEQVLRASKEIAVKFIEVGRISPANFADSFKTIYQAIDTVVRGGDPPQGTEPADK
jgi:hypothetical protein